MEKLPTDLLQEIFDYLDPNREDGNQSRWAPYQKRYRPSEIRSESTKSISQLRLVCKRFRELGARYLFKCVVQRFDRGSLQKLDLLASNPEIASCVRKFVYLMPYLYIEGANDLDYFLRENDERHFSYPSQTIDQPGTFEKILQEQQNIIQSEYDLKVLKHAMRAFHSLKSVHILQSAGDKAIDHRRIFVIGRPDSPDYAYSCWVPACRRAMETVLEALRYGKPPIDSFRCPGLSPQGLSQLPHEIQGNAISSVSNTLRCLELHFDSRVHSTLVSSTILSPSLPEVLRRIFSAADKLEKLYLGFSSSHPLDVSLESVFHGVTWGKLESIAIDSWVLSAKELVDFLNRHALTLREIRLANIHLREQDRWVRDFVIPLTEICRSNGVLKQITLEDCDYERDFSTTNHFDSEAVNRALGIVSPDSDEEMEETDSIASSTTVHAPFTLDPQESVYSELHAVKLSSKRFTERELAEELDTLLREDTGNPVAHEQRRRWEQCILSSAWG